MKKLTKKEELKALFFAQMEARRAKEVAKGIKSKMIKFPPQARKLLQEYKDVLLVGNRGRIGGNMING
jgi:hypothetical protein